MLAIFIHNMMCSIEVLSCYTYDLIFRHLDMIIIIIRMILLTLVIALNINISVHVLCIYMLNVLIVFVIVFYLNAETIH